MRRFPLDAIVKILLMIVALVAIVMTKDMCGQSVANLFNTIAPPVAIDGGRPTR
jgi:hypothetical protein